MRFSATDRRTGAALLWCALLVLGWALLSVMFGASAAHADDRGRGHAGDVVATASAPVHTTAQKTAVGSASAAPAPRVDREAPKTVASLGETTAAAPRTAALHVPSTTHLTAAVGTTTVAPMTSTLKATALKSTLPKTTAPKSAVLKTSEKAASKAKAVAKAAVRDSIRKPHPHADRTADPGVAAASARVRDLGPSVIDGVPAAARAATTAAALAASTVSGSDAAPTPQSAPAPSSGDPHSLTTPPATPPAASSAQGGASATAALIPDDAHPDLSGAHLAAPRATDDALPSGPAGTTDVSPD